MTGLNFVDRVQRLISRSSLLTTAAIKLRNQSNAVIGYRLSVSSDFNSNGESWLLDLIAPHASFFVDVGANVGDWSQRFASRMQKPRGLVFEPAPATLDELQKNLATFDGIEIADCALADFIGLKTFHVNSESSQLSSFVGLGNGQTVKVSRLDHELARRHIDHVDYLKIDAEGYDLHVLQGAEAALEHKKIDALQFEYNSSWASAGSSLGGAIDLLRGFGYRTYLIRGDALFEFPHAHYHEYFRYSNFLSYCDGSLSAVLDPLPKQTI